MIVNFLKPILIFIPLAAIQLAVVPLIAVQNMAPNLVLILLVYYSLIYGQIFGTILGFVLGFLLDLVSGGAIGGFMFTFTLAGFIAGYFYGENKFDVNLATFVFTLIVFLCSSIALFIYSVIANDNAEVQAAYQVIADGLIPGAYTAIFSIPVVIFSSRRTRE